MKKVALIILLTLIYNSNLFAQQVIGGDITWTCINSGPDAGKYKFKLTLFNECAQGAMPLSQTINVYNNPSLSSISMMLNSEKDISPICYDPAQELSCDSASADAKSMAIYYSSAVALSGVPPATGWGFTWTSNSRNLTSSNLSSAGGAGYTLRSVMHNYKNANKNVCYDNSPQFLEHPIINYCTGYSMNINNYAYDPDNDQVNHSWAVPMGITSTFPPTSSMAWQPGYSTNSPFPGTFHSSLNVPAGLEVVNGTIFFSTVVTPPNDKIYYSIKVQSIRDSVVISEVYREMMAAPKACPPTPTFPPVSNTPPQVTFKSFPGSPTSLPLPVFDTIIAGDTLNFNFLTIDFQFLPGFIGQTNFTYPYSSQLGTNFSSSSSGCDQPPCATIAPSTGTGLNSTHQRFEAQFGVEANFQWATDSIHGSPQGNWYHFHFYTQDDWCPTPGINLQTYSVLVYGDSSNIVKQNVIKGIVFEDKDSNGTKGASEGFLKNILLKRTPQLHYTSTNILGEYSFSADTGTYTIEVIPPLYYQSTIPVSGIHTVTTIGNGNKYLGKDFGLKMIPNINDLYVDLTAGGGARRPGFPRYYWLTYKNNGTTTLSGSIDFHYSFPLNYDSSSVTPNSTTANSLTWNYSNLPPGGTQSQVIYFRIDTSANTGDTLFVTAYGSPVVGDTLPVDNQDSILALVTNSFDPNYKEVDPGRDLYLQEIKDQKYIYYTVHFQNTGVVPAIDVRITDELEPNLNIETIELISSSHNYVFEVDGRELSWIFNGINLPDSGSDFLGSQGFVKFRIIADSSLNIGDSITNAINIYFDYNLPIYADVVTHIVEEDTTVGIKDLSTSRKLGENVLTLFPNPAYDLVKINLNTAIKNEPVSIRLFSITGKEVRKTNGLVKDGELSQSIDIQTLESGVYFVLISSKRINISSKVIKQ